MVKVLKTIRKLKLIVKELLPSDRQTKVKLRHHEHCVIEIESDQEPTVVSEPKRRKKSQNQTIDRMLSIDEPNQLQTISNTNNAHE